MGTVSGAEEEGKGLNNSQHKREVFIRKTKVCTAKENP